MSTKIGYLGPAGSFSQAVCGHLYPQENYPDWQFFQYADLSLLIEAIAKGDLSLAVLPTQNSKSGVLVDKQEHEFLGALVSELNNLVIYAEEFWVLNFLLLGHNNGRIEQIKIIHLNPYAQEQCQEYLMKHVDWEIHKHNSSAAAAKAAKVSGNPSHAAIASVDAAREYDLKILDQELFQPGDEPIMHFLVLHNSRQAVVEAVGSGAMITSFAITGLPMKRVQELLATSNFELSMLRASKNVPDRCYVDIKGRIATEELLTLLQIDAVKCLGTFPASSNRARYQDKFQQ